MIFRRQLLTLALAAAGAALGMAQTNTTTNPVTRQSSFPVVGLASTETVQVNVVNNAAATASGTAASCTGTISFLNATGNTIGTATSFTVGSGQIFSAALPFTGTGATSGSRTLIRGVVAVTFTPGSGVPCRLASTLETFDTTTGVTHVHLNDGQGLGGFGR
jgi:hypothetical protein